MSDMTLADALEKVQEWIGELVEMLDPSVTIQRLDEPVKASTASTAPTTPCPATLGSNKCSRPAGHCGDHANAEMFWSDQWTPKWREMVDQQSTFADTFAGQPLAAVLYNMYLCTEDYFLLNRLAHIVAVCERQVPGWKAEPYNSDGFSVYRLVSAFGDGSSNDKTEPQSYDWMALGEEAASWLKHLTEADDD